MKGRGVRGRRPRPCKECHEQRLERRKLSAEVQVLGGVVRDVAGHLREVAGELGMTAGAWRALEKVERALGCIKEAGIE